MMIRLHRFNFNLLALVLVVLVCGCAHKPVKKINASLRLHQEMRADTSGRAVTIELFRAQPFSLTIDKGAILTENNVKKVEVVDAMGGFALRILFDKKGTWLLEQYTAAMRGKHLAIFSSFPPPGEKQPGPGRWLAAPLISERITNGTLVFTPDASREEALQIANGLNNVAKKVHIDEPYDEW
jgi:preprotein translocase subunit SecD